MNPVRIRLLQTALIILAGWWVFTPAFHGSWLWDDAAEIIGNPLRSDPAGLWKEWFAPESPDYFPLKASVRWLQWRLWQDQTLGYHLTNVGLHLLSALLLWHLFKKLGLRLAWFGALLFAVHPVAVESVAWISELKNTLSLPPLLLAMCAWLDYDEQKRRSDYWRALLFFLAAMLCKSTVVMLPVILLLYAWWKRGRITRAETLAGAPFFAISLGLGLVTVWFQYHRAVGGDIISAGGFFQRLAGAGRAVLFYFSKGVFPVGLQLAYPLWPAPTLTLRAYLPWLLLGLVFGGLWVWRSGWGRHVLLGGGLFLINLAPVLGVIPMSYHRVSWVADHLAYLPLTGLLGLAVAGAGAGYAWLAAPLRGPAIGGAMLIVGLLAWQSHRYAGTFRNDATAWSHVLQRDPESWLAHNNLGLALTEAGRLTEAIWHLQEAVRVQPNAVAAHYNLGLAFVRSNRLTEAIGQYEEALRINPDLADVHYNEGIALYQTGRLPEAVEHYAAAVRLRPDFLEAHYNLGIALFRLGRLAEAVKFYEQALHLRPDYPIQLNLGVALLKMGRVREAIGHLQEALRLQPNAVAAHDNLGLALAQAGRPAEAIRHYEAVLQLKPDYAEAHLNLGVALAQAGRLADAKEQFEQALRLKPDYPSARINLSRLQAFEEHGRN